jgi:flagellar biosynthesis/type III secretory pathway chaperone
VRQKTPEFDASNDPVVRKSKGLQKLRNLMEHMSLAIVMNQKKGKKIQNLTKHMSILL